MRKGWRRSEGGEILRLRFAMGTVDTSNYFESNTVDLGWKHADRQVVKISERRDFLKSRKQKSAEGVKTCLFLPLVPLSHFHKLLIVIKTKVGIMLPTLASLVADGNPPLYLVCNPAGAN